MSQDTTTDLAKEKFVALTTYKRNGDAVAAPMWIVPDGHRLRAWTPADAWKVKRIRHDPRVALAVCSRTGKVQADQPVFDGTAEVISDPEEVARIESFVKQKWVGVSDCDAHRSHCGSRPQAPICLAHHSVQFRLTNPHKTRRLGVVSFAPPTQGTSHSIPLG
jgi:PPOX class probable F420-dependent enzyme